MYRQAKGLLDRHGYSVGWLGSVTAWLARFGCPASWLGSVALLAVRYPAGWLGSGNLLVGSVRLPDPLPHWLTWLRCTTGRLGSAARLASYARLRG